MRNFRLFFPDWALIIYIPSHIYVFFDLAKQSYGPRGIGFALFPVLIIGFATSFIGYLVLNYVLFKTFEQRTLMEVLKGEKGPRNTQAGNRQKKTSLKRFFIRKTSKKRDNNE